jgi:hypothetical protein
MPGYLHKGMPAQENEASGAAGAGSAVLEARAKDDVHRFQCGTVLAQAMLAITRKDQLANALERPGIGARIGFAKRTT